MPLNVEVHSTLYKRIGGSNYLKLALTWDRVGDPHPEAKVYNEAPNLDRMEVDKSSEYLNFISRNARKRAKRRARKANNATRPEVIQEVAENLVAPIKELDKDSGKKSENYFSEFVYRSSSPTIVVEEGEQNLSPRIIEPPKNRTTNYDENVREWRKRY